MAVFDTHEGFHEVPQLETGETGIVVLTVACLPVPSFLHGQQHAFESLL